MDSVIRLLTELLPDERQVFVFPSEIAAEFWRRKSLHLSSRRAIWEDRFLSWDRFKEKSFQLSQRAAPVNRTIRTLFAADLLEQNITNGPLLTSVVSTRFAETSRSFLRTLTSILPELARYRRAVDSRAARQSPVDPEMHADLELLWQRYRAFLDDNGLFEPSFDSIDVSRLSETYHVFFPEVLEDWEEARPHLDPQHIKTVAIGLPPASPILRYENSVQELRSFMQDVSILLGSGVDPTEIVLSVPRLEAWESVLRRDADLTGIPLDFRQGKPLSEYPEARLFARLYECAAGGFSLEGLKALLLSRAFPWRHRSAGEALVRWGIDHHCAGSYRAGGVEHDPWTEKLELAAAGDGGGASLARSLASFYRSFSRDIRQLCGAHSFGGLKGGLQRFINTWLETGRWSSESLRVFQFSLNALNDLAEAKSRVSGIGVKDPYALWLSALGERLYVPRSGAAGVPVYPYRVAAGIFPEHHFLLGASQAATQVEWRPLSFLREDERERLGIRDETASNEFLALYLQSGARVSVSFSDVDTSGIQLPPGHFILRGLVERPRDIAARREADPYLREMRLWSQPGADVERAFERQKQGASSFERAGSARRGDDLTHAALGDRSVAESIAARLYDESGRLVVSPTRLDAFWECPFAFLFSNVLRIEERSYRIEWADPRLIGSLIHEILKRLFERIAGSDARFEPRRLEEYHNLLSETARGLFEEWEQRGEALVPPVWFGLRPHLVERLGQFLEVEAQRFAGLAASGVEASYSHAGEDLLLEGRIDRVSSDERGLLLVDYKRRLHVRKGDLIGREGAEERSSETEDATPADHVRPTTFQIPFYVALIESIGERVRTAAYYDVEGGKYAVVFDDEDPKAWFDRYAMDRLLAETERAITEMKERVEAGMWTVPDPHSGCEQCRLRAVCRMKYAVR